MTKEQYLAFHQGLLDGEKTEFREWEKNTPYFEGCMPIEVMASRWDKHAEGSDGDYINCPMTKEQYLAFHQGLLDGEKTEFREWEMNTPYFRRLHADRSDGSAR